MICATCVCSNLLCVFSFIFCNFVLSTVYCVCCFVSVTSLSDEGHKSVTHSQTNLQKIGVAWHCTVLWLGLIWPTRLNFSICCVWERRSDPQVVLYIERSQISSSNWIFCCWNPERQLAASTNFTMRLYFTRLCTVLMWVNLVDLPATACLALLQNLATPNSSAKGRINQRLTTHTQVVQGFSRNRLRRNDFVLKLPIMSVQYYDGGSCWSCTLCCTSFSHGCVRKVIVEVGVSIILYIQGIHHSFVMAQALGKRGENSRSWCDWRVLRYWKEILEGSRRR